MMKIEEYPNYYITIDGVLFKKIGPDNFKEIKAYRHKSSTCIYKRVTLFVNKKRIRKFIHELVLLAYEGPKPKGLEVNHIDLNSLNNNLDNLEYITPSENIQHSLRMKTN